MRVVGSRLRAIVQCLRHIVAKPADIDELLCAAVLSVFRSCKHNE